MEIGLLKEGGDLKSKIIKNEEYMIGELFDEDNYISEMGMQLFLSQLRYDIEGIYQRTHDMRNEGNRVELSVLLFTLTACDCGEEITHVVAGANAFGDTGLLEGMVKFYRTTGIRTRGGP